MDVLIRLANAGDAEALAAIYQPFVEQSRVSFEEVAPSAEEMAGRIVGPQPGMHPWLVAEEEGRLHGFAASSPFRSRRAYRWSVETGIYVDEQSHGRGIGRKLLAALVELLTRQGYVAAIGAIALPNEASVRLHEALGFDPAGVYRRTGFKMGEWIDVGLWQKDLAARSDDPAEPRPFDGLFSPG